MTDQVNADWTELQVTIPAADTDRAGDIAQMVVPYGIYFEVYSHFEEEGMDIANIDLIDEDLLKKYRTKSIIHINIAIACQLLGKFRVILSLFFMETQVFQQDNFAILHIGDCCIRAFSNYVSSKSHLIGQQPL